MATVSRPPRRENVSPYRPPIGKLPPPRPAPPKPAPAPAVHCDNPRLLLAIGEKAYGVEFLGREPGDGAYQVIRLHPAGGGDPYDVAELGPEHDYVPHADHPGFVCDCKDYLFHREGKDPAGCKHIRALAAVGLLRPANPRPARVPAAPTSPEASRRTAEYLADDTPKIEAWLIPFLVEREYSDEAINDCWQWAWHCKTLRGCRSIEPGDFDHAERIVQAACGGDAEPPRDEPDDETPTLRPCPKPLPPPTPAPIPAPPKTEPTKARPRRPFGEGIPGDEPTPATPPTAKATLGRNAVDRARVREISLWATAARGGVL